MSITVTRTGDIFDGQARIGFVIKGANGKYFAVGMDKASHAHPLGNLDNLAGFGFASRQAAAEAFADESAQ